MVMYIILGEQVPCGIFAFELFLRHLQVNLLRQLLLLHLTILYDAMFQ
jgi:hypothetical protein